MDKILALLKLNILKAQPCMKNLADKHRTELEFSERDWVFVKFKPYRQNSVCMLQHPKLGRRYFGPFHVLKRIVQVAYKLELPDASRIHHVFHVYMLKYCIGEPAQQVTPLQLTDFIPPSNEGPGLLNLEDKVLT
ncbi:uncharacterized protein [Nicotiana tomentosiformis]|uniref:uncharacterized protein n=1 Tax=Nicotiana tomentosiformis TaxID=4098 RepID=UPI00388CC1DA